MDEKKTFAEKTNEMAEKIKSAKSKMGENLDAIGNLMGSFVPGEIDLEPTIFKEEKKPVEKKEEEKHEV